MGLSILEFPKARGSLDEDAARGRVWIFSGITQSRNKRALLGEIMPLCDLCKSCMTSHVANCQKSQKHRTC